MTLAVTLVTRGSPDQLTGGHLYHRRLAERAASQEASISIVQVGRFQNLVRQRPDVVVVDSIAAWSVALRLVRRGPTPPLAAILHQPPGGVDRGVIRRTWQRPLDRALYGRCRLLIATSAALGAELADDHGLPDHRITVIEPGSDLPPAEAAPDLRDGCRIAILCVANWLPNKGMLELLDAVGGLDPGDAMLHLAGREDVDAAYRRRIMARLQSPDLARRVVRHGPVTRDHIGRLYRGADAFVLPSYRETYGTAYGEALAAGLPTIGWSSSNLRNLIENGREGVLLRKGDVAGLRAALARLSTDGTWRSELATGARLRGEQLPTWDTTGDAFFAALRELAGGRG